MKRNRLFIPCFSIIASAMIVSSCSTKSLDLQPKGSISADQVWTDPILANAFVVNIYGGLSTGGFASVTLSDATDETIYNHDATTNSVNAATVTADNTGYTNSEWEWGNMYSHIRACNIVFASLPSASFDNATKAQLAGEAHFLRGYFYNQLLRMYGAVPLVSKVYSLSDSFNVARNTYEECVDFILADCDSAILDLQGTSLQQGRATPLAAMALKSRVLTYAASDLYDIPTAKQKSSLIAGYSHPEYIGYLSGDRTARWTAAQTASKALLTATTGYKLDLIAPASADDAKANYIALCMGGGSSAPGVDPAGASELVFARYFNAVTDNNGWASDAAFFHLYQGPNGYHNWSNNSPVGQLVDDYQMMDGSDFSWSNPAEKAAPYKNRDPRFYASILFDGAQWKPRSSDVAPTDPMGETQMGYYDIMQNGQKAVWNGLDTKKSTVENWNASPTGYNMIKFVDVNPAIQGQNDHQYIPWPIFRYTEVVFNYAEACNALGQDAEAISWINKIRFRAGMPALSSSLAGTQLRDAIRHEKRIEMVMENQRYYDIRRWMIAGDVMKTAEVINITATFKSGQSASGNYHHDETVYDYTYDPTSSQDAIGFKTWDDKMYFRPISRGEILKAPLMYNNPGFDN